MSVVMPYEREVTTEGLIGQLFMPAIDTSRVSDGDIRRAIERGYQKAKTAYPRIKGERDDRTIPVTLDHNAVTPEGIPYKGVTQLGVEYRGGRPRVAPKRIGINARLPPEDAEEVTEHEALHAKLMDNEVDLSQYMDVHPTINHLIQEAFTEYSRVWRARKEGNERKVFEIFAKSPYKNSIKFGAMANEYYKGKNGEGFYAFINDMIEWRSMAAAIDQLKYSIREAYRNGKIKEGRKVLH